LKLIWKLRGNIRMTHTLISTSTKLDGKSGWETTVRTALAGPLQSTKGSFNLDGAQFPFASQVS
jgi:hypothetical protein